MFAVEQDGGRTGGTLTANRRGHARPILDTFADWPAEQKWTGLPKSPFGQTVAYAVNLWTALARYASAGHRQRAG